MNTYQAQTIEERTDYQGVIYNISEEAKPYNIKPSEIEREIENALKEVA